MSRESHIDRKLLKKPDSFVVLGRKLLAKLLEERKVLWVAGAVVAAGAAIYYGYGAWHNSRLNRDWLAYHLADEAKPEEQTAKRKEVFEKGGRTRAAFLAAVSLGDHYLQAAQAKVEATKAEGKSERTLQKDTEPKLSLEESANAASEWYKKALAFSFLLPAEKEMLILDEGNSLEIAGKREEAKVSYQKAADMNGPVKPLALLHLGRLYEAAQDREKAKSLYQSVSTDFGSTEYSRVAKNYLRRMDSPLLANP
jgi:hypothetical protein